MEMTPEEALEFIRKHYCSKGYSKCYRLSMFNYCGKMLTDLKDCNISDFKSWILNWLGEQLRNLRHNTTKNSCKRVVYLVLYLTEHGTMPTKCFSYKRIKQHPATEAWSLLLANFMIEKQKEGRSVNTLKFDYQAVVVFIKYLEFRSVFQPGEISHRVIHDFQDWNAPQHKSAEGYRAYLYRVRNFLRYLIDINILSESFEYALLTDVRPVKRPVTILDVNQVKKVLKQVKNSDSPITKRDIAMFNLSFRQGLRAIDIVNLKFENIDWVQGTISLVQHKTDLPIVLPLDKTTGNCLAEYVLCYRPHRSKEPQVFVSHSAPFGKLNSTVCYGASLRLFGPKQGREDLFRGLHIARRTFASNLLRAGSTRHVIAAMLGHSQLDTVDAYLATNLDTIRKCSIDLSVPGIPEVFR